MPGKLFKYRPNVYHHATFSAKRRKPVLAGKVGERIGYLFDKLVHQQGFELIELNAWLDHVHMLIFVWPGEDLAYIMNILKGTTARRVSWEFSDLKMRMGEESPLRAAVPRARGAL